MIYLLTLSLFILTILVLALAIKQKLKGLLLVFLIPFLIFNIGFTYHTIKEIWGYAVEDYPKSDVELLAYKIEQPNIIIVIREQTGLPRLYMIPYEKKHEEKLEGAGKAMKKGQRIMMKKNEGVNEQESNFELYSWKPAESMPKETK